METKLKNRFKNRFIAHENYVEWFTPRDFRAGIWAMNERKESSKPKCGLDELRSFLKWRVRTGGFIHNINKSEMYRKKFKQYDLA